MRQPALDADFSWRWISKSWRIFATGLAFATAGVFLLTFALLVIPVIRLCSGTREQGEFHAQYVLHSAIRAHLGFFSLLGVLRIRFEGAEKLRKPGILVVANHPTMIDALILTSLMPRADCVVKARHFDSFWLRGTSRGVGYIPMRNGPQLVEECVERLRAGRSLIIFPEGTRSPRDELGQFTRGAAHIAWRAGCDVVPVTIRCVPATLYRGLAWWAVPDRRFTVTLTIDDPLSINDIVSQPISRPRAARAITAALRDHFERRLSLVRDQPAA